MSTPWVWGSFERNTGTWTPYSAAENAAIEDAFARGDPSIDLPTCFNAVLHFNRSGGHHHQSEQQQHQREQQGQRSRATQAPLQGPHQGAEGHGQHQGSEQQDQALA
jgi:hypothetical protein